MENNRNDEMLKNYFGQKTERFSFDQNKMKREKTRLIFTLCLVACLVLVLSLEFILYKPTANSPESSQMIYSTKNNVALANLKYGKNKIKEGRLGIIRLDRDDILGWYAESEGDGTVFSCLSSCDPELYSKNIDITLTNRSPIKAPVDAISLKDGHKDVNYIYGKVLTIGYVNYDKTDETFKITVIYVDGSTSTHYIKADYREGAPIENELELTLIKSEYFDAEQN